MDPNITTISPVNKLHPRDDVLACGSSRSIFIWRPNESFELEQRDESRRIVLSGKGEKVRKGKSGYDSGEDDYDDHSKSGNKSLKTKKSGLKNTVLNASFDAVLKA